MILSGSEIRAQLGKNILIEPYTRAAESEQLQSRLHDELLVYEEIVLDMRRPNRFRRITIPAEGLILQPNMLYLGRTIEYTETRNLVPMLEGRSSIGRLGLFVHVTAGFGDVGFAAIGRSKCSRFSPSAFIPAFRFVRCFITRGRCCDRVSQRQVSAQS